MRLYKTSLASVLLFFTTFSYAQDTITYFNKAMERVCCRDSASFYRIGINDHGFYQDSIKDYYITGELLQKGFYPKWRGQGEFVGYYKNGKKSYVQTLMHNEITLISKWDNNGVKTVKRGTGEYVTYDNFSRRVIAKGNYKGGLKVGHWVWNNSTGNRIAERTYGKNEKVISYNAWDDKGERQLVSNGNGKVVRYYTNGRRKLSESWSNSKREGKYTELYENGYIKCEGTYKNDKREGVWKWYYDNGECYEEISYTDGILHGEVLYKGSTGAVRCKGQYTFGRKSGTWEWYTEEGRPHWSFNYL